MKMKNKSNHQQQKVRNRKPLLPKTQLAKIDKDGNKKKGWDLTTLAKILGALAGLGRLIWEILRSWGQTKL